LVGLAGLGAVVDAQYDRLRDAAAELMFELDARLRTAPPERIAIDVRSEPPAGTRIAVAPLDAPRAAEAADGGVETVAEQPRVPTTTLADAEVVPEFGSTEARPAETLSGESVPTETATGEAPLDEASSVGSAVPVSPGEADFRFVNSVITVSEGQGAAPVMIERSDETAPASLVWWTSADTAVAGEDYADFGQSTETFAAGEKSRVLLVPLVSDSVREDREGFHVYLGRFDARERQLELLATTRVEISDDD
jgi:hypothetical protein